MIAICVNPYRDNELELTQKALKLLESAGFESVVCPVFAESGDAVLPDGLNYCELEDLKECSLAIVIGGDGTILYTARRLYKTSTPILGVNLGTMGFMTALEPDELPEILKAARGECRVSRRMMLSVSLERDGEQIFSDCALNDAVLHGYGDCIKLTTMCDESAMSSFSGDGIILSTPTGSTGYSLSAGGPVVEPDVEAIIVSPICAHMMGSRSFVIGPEKKVSVMAEKLRGRRAYLSLDGNWAIDLQNGDVVTARRSEYRTLMAHMSEKNFYETAYKKLT